MMATPCPIPAPRPFPAPWNCTAWPPTRLYAALADLSPACLARRAAIVARCAEGIGPYEFATSVVVALFLAVHLAQGAYLVCARRGGACGGACGGALRAAPSSSGLILPIYFTFLKLQLAACTLWVGFWAACIFFDLDPTLRWNLASDTTGLDLSDASAPTWSSAVSLCVTAGINVVPLCLEVALLCFLSPRAAGRDVWDRAKYCATFVGLLAFAGTVAVRERIML